MSIGAERETKTDQRAPRRERGQRGSAVAGFVLQHWLLMLNAALGLLVALPVLAPLWMHWGLTPLGQTVYAAYRFACHQWPHRSFFLFGDKLTYSLADLTGKVDPDPLRLGRFIGDEALGFKVAFCQRDVAIYASMLAFGLLFALLGRRLSPLGWGLYLALIVPMAVDGLTQLVGWRESTWELRAITGALFGTASAWLVFPRLELVMGELAKELAEAHPTSARVSIGTLPSEGNADATDRARP